MKYIEIKYNYNKKTDNNYQFLTLTNLSVFILTFILYSNYISKLIVRHS